MLVANSLLNEPETLPVTGIDHNYLPLQFADMEAIWAKVREVVKLGDFTLGQALADFERQVAEVVGVKHAIGVNSGTDALILTMKAMNITGEVLVPAFTFVASVASVVLAGAKPVLVDVGTDFNIDPTKIEEAVTSKTEAIMPVHWAGRPCDMDRIRAIASWRGLFVIEDACHAIGAKYRGASCGALGVAGAFSLHPLKNVNVWGDGGFVTTNHDTLADKLRLLRNHGLIERNYCAQYAHNSRLDTVQAVVASHVLGKLEDIVNARRYNALLLDHELQGIPGFYSVPIAPHSHMTYYLYTAHAERRNELVHFLNVNGVDAKVHYAVPQHLQPAAVGLGYKQGDFPVAEDCANTTISLPVHEFVTESGIVYMAALIRTFYGSKRKANGKA